MTEAQRDLHILISIAKLDASLNAARTELAILPGKVDRIKGSLDEMAGREVESKSSIEEMEKERRELEQKLDDNAEQTKKYRVQLMEVKTNKEYTAMLHEIDHVEKDTEAKEERLLMLMDELDREVEENKTYLEKNAKERVGLESRKAELEDHTRSLEEEARKLESEKPKLLIELDPRLKKRYDRILAKLHDFAVTHVENETCQGCFARITPQTSVEVKKNDKIIACEACGRILVHYNA